MLSEGVVKIGDKAFAMCTALDKIVLPKTLTEIGFGMLDGDESIRVFAYRGSQADWAKVKKPNNWNNYMYLRIEYNSKL